MRAHVKGFDVKLEDQTDSWQMLALQGAARRAILGQLTKIPLGEIKYYKHRGHGVNGVANAWVSRTGYTGEDGFEVYVPRAEAEKTVGSAAGGGKPRGLAPIGLGARDTLRLEAGMPLYGHELADDINPIEAGLDFAVKFVEGKDFIGRKALEAGENQQMPPVVGLRAEQAGAAAGLQRSCSRRRGGRLRLLGDPLAHPACQHWDRVRRVRRGGPGDKLEIDVRGSREPAVVVPLPFYKRAK